MPNAQLTANAILARTVWNDTFTRTVGNSDPWQPGDWGSEYTIEYLSAGVRAWVDGSVGHVTMRKGIDVLLPEDFKQIDYGSIQFDYLVPANTADNYPYVYVLIGGRFPVTLEIWNDGGSTWAIWMDTRWSWPSTEAYYTFDPEPSTWYRFKGVFSGAPEGIIGVKVWKVGDIEPPDFQSVGSFGSSPKELTDPDNWYDQYLTVYGPTLEDLSFDNLVIANYGVPYSPTSIGTLLVGAVKRRTMAGIAKTIDAIIAARSFSVGAWIIGGRSGHSRFWDHHGTQPDTVVVIDGPIGPHPSGTTVHVVLASLIARIEALEDGEHSVGTFSVGAWIEGVLRVNAIIQRLGTAKTTTLNAEIQGGILTSFSIDAVIIRAPTMTFSMGAYFIDLVC